MTTPVAHSGKIKALILVALFVMVGVIVLIMALSQSTSDVARQQLTAIKAGDIQQAYAMTSTEFQKATSLKQFKKFLQSYPILSDSNSVTFSERKIDNGMGYLAGTLTGPNGNTKNIEFQLIKEDEQWKIQGIQLSDKLIDSNTALKDHARIHAILVSDEADSDGFVNAEKIKISANARKIYATIQILSSSPGGAVSATLIHLPQGTKTGPSIDKTTKGGNIMKAFSFSRKEKTWPTGRYEVQVELSSGKTKVYKFEVV